MPGIVTHSRILKESIEYCAKKEKRTYLQRSLETLFSTREHVTAALFGAIGPNIFDYLPVVMKRSAYGSELSFHLHNGGSGRFIEAMISTITSYEDKNTEWAALQRAYCYGFISHIIADAVFHPFVFYYSGFPMTKEKREQEFYREQNLLFQYHLDNYIQYHEEHSSHYVFSLSDMFPRTRLGFVRVIDLPIRTILFHALAEACPDPARRFIPTRAMNRDPRKAVGFSLLDAIPPLMRLTYAIKRTNNPRVADLIRRIRRSKFMYSDFLVRYPMNRRFNKHILNLQKERWDHPAGKPGLHYESVPNLLALSRAKTVEIWEEIESTLYGNTPGGLSERLAINAYTGDVACAFNDLKIKHPIRLHL